MEKRKLKLLWVPLLFMGACLAGCSDLGTDDDGDGTGLKNVSGAVQKGPFVTGTRVKLQELDSDLLPVSSGIETQITDDFGSFSGRASSGYVEAIATGYYYNEVGGHLSESQITLRSVSKVGNASTVNINILTTLQTPRIRTLVAEGKSFESAVAQSQVEVLDAFGITLEDCPSFDKMNIAQEGEGNAVLLAISSIMQVDRNEAQLTEFIAKVANDIGDNGKLDKEELVEAIRQSHMRVSPKTVRENLTNRYIQLGQTDVVVPDFAGYLDSNGDGELNEEATDINIRMGLEVGGSKRLDYSDSLDVRDITIVIFDKNGNRFFSLRDENPDISGQYTLPYSFCIERDKPNMKYPNCSIYVILNSVEDYSEIICTETELLAMQLALAQEQVEKQVESGEMFSGKITQDLFTYRDNYVSIGISQPFAKVVVGEVTFGEDIPLEQQVVNSIYLKGAYTSSYLFDREREDGVSVTDIPLLLGDDGSYYCYVMNNSPLKLVVETTGGTLNVTMVNYYDGLVIDKAKANLTYLTKMKIMEEIGGGSVDVYYYAEIHDWWVVEINPA